MHETSNRHAYLIIAHNEPVLLKTLVSLIDDQRNDIFLLIDKKANIKQFSNLKANKSNLVYTNRTKVWWGGVSQIRAELILFETAFNYGNYSYYHLLSGIDLPLKTQNYIHDFFGKNDGKEFVGFESEPVNVEERVLYRHFFMNWERVKYISRITSKLRIKIVDIQKKLNLKRKIDFEVKKGVNWCSVTSDFVKYLLEHKNWILKTYKNTYCCDEVFLHSILWNSKFRSNLFEGQNEYEQCLREIDWGRGSPYTYTIEDKELLLNSNKLFARKFSSKNMEIVEVIKRTRE